MYSLAKHSPLSVLILLSKLAKPHEQRIWNDEEVILYCFWWVSVTVRYFFSAAGARISLFRTLLLPIHSILNERAVNLLEITVFRDK